MPHGAALPRGAHITFSQSISRMQKLRTSARSGTSRAIYQRAPHEPLDYPAEQDLARRPPTF